MRKRWKWADTAIVSIAVAMSYALFTAYMHFVPEPREEPAPIGQTQHIENFCGCLDDSVRRAAIYFPKGYLRQDSLVGFSMRFSKDTVESVIANTSWGDCDEYPTCGYSAVPYYLPGAWRTTPEWTVLEWQPVVSRWNPWTCVEDSNKVSICDQLMRKPPLSGTIDEVRILRVPSEGEGTVWNTLFPSGPIDEKDLEYPEGYDWSMWEDRRDIPRGIACECPQIDRLDVTGPTLPPYKVKINLNGEPRNKGGLLFGPGTTRACQRFCKGARLYKGPTRMWNAHDVTIENGVFFADVRHGVTIKPENTYLLGETSSSPTSERYHKLLEGEGMQMHLGLAQEGEYGAAD